MNVLVTGNEGYIGSILAPYVASQGHAVTGLDTGLFRDVQFIPRASGLVRQISKDVRDITIDDLAGIDAVIHLAALSNDPVGELDPQLTEQINYHGTMQMAELARQAGVRRFLFSSSCSMYGLSGQDFVSEEAPLQPLTAYAVSKVKVEQDLRQLATTEFSPIFLRNATAYGVSPRLRIDLVVQNLVALGYINGAIQLQSDGTPWRPLIHIKDIARAFTFFLDAPLEQVHNQSFNVGSNDQNVQIKQLAELIHLVMPQAVVSLTTTPVADQRSYRVDFNKVHQLGWHTEISLEAGINEVYQAFQQAKFNQTDFQSDQYNTLQRYKKWQQAGWLDADLRVQPAATTVSV